MIWSYGLTTVYHRRSTTLPITLNSLHYAGFPNPILFVDNCIDPQDWRREFNLEIVPRYPYIRTYGNWLLGLWELYIRSPMSDRYILFQDDLLCVKNLREYLEKCKYPKNGYVNLYTTWDNDSFVPRDRSGNKLTGFWPSNQLGKGALALVFSNEACAKLLTSPQTIERLTTPHSGTGNVDGCVVHNLSDRFVGPNGWREYIHHPSLVEHIGEKSMMGHVHMQKNKSVSFPGEDINALDLLEVAKAQLLNLEPTPAAHIKPIQTARVKPKLKGMLRKWDQ